MPYLETRLRHLRSAARQQDGEYQNQYHQTVSFGRPIPDMKHAKDTAIDQAVEERAILSTSPVLL
jgi:hypothetical protein